MSKTLILAQLIYLAQCQSQESSRVGYGVILIIVSVFVSMILYFLSKLSKYPEFFQALSTLIPLILTLIFVYSPKEKDKASLSVFQFQQDSPQSIRIVYILVFLIILAVTAGRIIFINLILFKRAQKVVSHEYNFNIQMNSNIDVQDSQEPQEQQPQVQ